MKCPIFFMLISLPIAVLYSQQPFTFFNSCASVGAYSNNFTDPFSLFQNQASLSELKYPSLGLYSERKFSLKELQLLSMVFLMPSHSAGFGLTLNRFGNKNFRQSGLALAYARTLSPNISLAVQFDYGIENIRGYQKKTYVNGAFAWKLILSSNLQAGFQLSNAGSLFLSQESMPVKYSTGIGYDLSKQCTLNLELSKEPSEEMQTRLMIHYAFIKEFFLRGALSNSYNNMFLSMGLNYKSSTTAISLSYHPQLGFTPSITIFFQFDKDKEDE